MLESNAGVNARVVAALDVLTCGFQRRVNVRGALDRRRVENLLQDRRVIDYALSGLS